MFGTGPVQVAGLVAASGYAQLVQPCSGGHSVGVYSSANYASLTGAGPDIGVPGNTIAFIANLKAISGDQTFWGYCRADRGWFIDINTSSQLRLYLRDGASNPNYPINTNIVQPPGYFAIAMTCLPSGEIRSSLSGLAVESLSLAP